MEKHIGDLVIDDVLRLRRLVKELLHKEYKRKKPLRMEPISDDEMLQRYESTTPEQWAELQSTHSPEDMEDYKNKMENMKIRRGYYA